MFGIKEGRPGKLWRYLDKFHGMKINSRYLLRGTWNKSNKTVWWFIYFSGVHEEFDLPEEQAAMEVELI